MPVKVSVVVPVYNPGPFIERCIASLLRQSMPAEDFEVLFVNDGSTDDTAERLDRLAAEHPHVRVFHEENSGWAGRPRNVGIRAARGDYVQFVDQDDALGRQALERLYAAGVRNDADVVLGKVVSNFRPVPHHVFRENVERCSVRDWPLIDGLTPHKMVRRQFLLDKNIFFPEGRRRLEDQLFMVRVYVAARTVSIVGDYPCYYYLERDDGQNAGGVLIEPVGYYANLREVLDALEQGIEPGEDRYRLMRRFYRSMTKRLSEPAVLHYEDAHKQTLYAEVRRIALERFPDEVPDGLPALTRVRSVLLREDRFDDLMTVAGRGGQVRALATVEQQGWSAGPRLRLAVEARLQFSDGSALGVVERDGRVLLDPRLVAGIVTDDQADCTADLPQARAEVILRERRSKLEWFAGPDLFASVQADAVAGTKPLVFAGVIEIDPATVAGGRPLGPGVWEPMLRIRAFGITREARFRVLDLSVGVPEPALLRRPKRLILPGVNPRGVLRLGVRTRPRPLAAAVAARGHLPVRVRRGRLVVELPVATRAGDQRWPARVILLPDGGGRPSRLPARLTADGDRLVLSAALIAAKSGTRRAEPGRYTVLLKTGKGRARRAPIGTVVVRRRDLTAGAATRSLRP
jgi:glycosyltransferase involved in cell wall biosynthesis